MGSQSDLVESRRGGSRSEVCIRLRFYALKPWVLEAHRASPTLNSGDGDNFERQAVLAMGDEA